MKRAWTKKYLTKNHLKMLFNQKGSKFNKKSSKTIVHGPNLQAQPATKLHSVNTLYHSIFSWLFTNLNPSTKTVIITPSVPIESNSPISKTIKSKFKSQLKMKHSKFEITVENEAFIETKLAKQVHRSSMVETSEKVVQNLPYLLMWTNRRKRSPKFTTISVVNKPEEQKSKIYHNLRRKKPEKKKCKTHQNHRQNKAAKKR